ncbi:MAG: site-2 protease family protein [Bacteroidota bacterium]
MDPTPNASRPVDSGILSDDSSPKEDRPWVNLVLFLATFVTTVWAGGYLIGRSLRWGFQPETHLDTVRLLLDPAYLTDGLMYAVPFLLFLTVHEFGHYIAARVRKTKVSLPYYLPIPILGAFGTFGAVIRIKEPLRTTRQLFDIGAAGPLAGFVVAVVVLLIGALTFPPPEYLLSVYGHESLVSEIQQTGQFPPFHPAPEPGTMAYVFGSTPLYHAVTGLAPMRVSPDELIHYPILLAGWLGLFFTALNLLPVGQLDGGHVVYAMFGPTVHRVVARVTTLLLLLSGGLGLVRDLAFINPLITAGILAAAYLLAAYMLFGANWRMLLATLGAMMGLTLLILFTVPGLAISVGWTGWMFWVAMILFVIRVDHPPVQIDEPLTPGRKALGWLCLAIFLLCFSIQPIYIV